MITNISNIPAVVVVQNLTPGDVLVLSGTIYMVTEARANVPADHTPVTGLADGSLTSIPNGTGVNSVTGSYTGSV